MKPLLEAADASINPGERVGLIGANGSGKSSLFSLLRGELHADKGEADFPPQWRVAHDAVEAPAFLAAHKAELEVAHEHWPRIRFHSLREHAGLVFHSHPVS